ncbi:peptidase S8/S53 domain-containing protein [Fennellomyces sp. T-0311]|nr:peptidase S8/S53 domain-containing protein [Fennellomyces sp. T-0311]
MFIINYILLVSIAFFGLAISEPHEVENFMQPIPGRYICELTGPDIDVDSQKLLYVLKGQLPGYEVTIPRIFDFSLFKGVTIQIDRIPRDGDGNLLAALSTDKETIFTGILKTIAKTGLIAHVYPVHNIQRPEIVAYTPADGTTDTNMLLPHKRTQVSRVQSELKNTGAGIKIGIVDSGVDYMHPALGGGFGPGYKVRYGRDLVGDNYDSAKGVPVMPDSDPMDSCKPTKKTPGHGTHVSGIIAGKSENFTGVAPDAVLGMWRVFSCTGSTSDEIIIEAMYEAYDVGVDIINLSLGTFFLGWPESALAVAAERITSKGVPVIASAGNDGEYGVFTTASPSVGHGAFSVASFDNGYTLGRDGHEIIAVPTDNLVSSFSSIGASSEIDLTPNIAGIGGYVYSTLPRAAGSWGILSGTSMAAPYVAGSVALYLKSLEGISKPTPAYILEQFQNYAYQTFNAPGQSNIDSPYRQGAGLIQVYDTIQHHVHIVPGGISFNDTASIQKIHTLTITNDGNMAVSYQIVSKISVSVLPYGLSPSVYFVEPPQYGQDFAKLAFSAETIEVQPGSSVDITVTVIPPTTDPNLHIMYGGFIQFKDLQGQRDLTVPYIGIVGNQRDLPIFGSDTPFTTDSTYSPGSNVRPNHIYGSDDTYVFDRSIPGSGPVFGISLPNPTREILAPLYSQDGVQIGFAFTGLVNSPRAHKKEMYTTLQWDGTFTPSILGINIPIKLPVFPGKYRVGFEALKWLGDPNSQNDRETWTSCVIQVQ